MTLEEVISVIKKAEEEKKTTVRLHTETPASMVPCASSLTG